MHINLKKKNTQENEIVKSVSGKRPKRSNVNNKVGMSANVPTILKLER